MTPRELDFADSFESSSAPAAGFTTASNIRSFVDDAAYVTAKGSAAAAGDIYHNTTSNQVREYNGSAWREIVASVGAQTIAGTKTFSDNVVITGDLTVNGTTTTLNVQTLDVEDANITVNKGGNQASADAARAGIEVEMSDAAEAGVGYDSTLASKFKIGEVGSQAQVVSVSHTQTLTNKTIDADANTITNIEDADIKALAAIARSKIAAGSNDHVVINSGAGALSSEASLAITRGGTGAATAIAGFNALSPITTKGDLISKDTTNNVRLAVGTNGQILTADSAETTGLKWTTPAASAALTPTSVKTANYTAASGDLVLCDATGGAFTITFPAGSAGARIGVKKIATDTSFNKITQDGNGSETLDGALTRKLCTFGEYQEWVWASTYWARVIHTFGTGMMDLGVVNIGAVTTPPTKSVAMITDKVRGYRLASGLLKMKFDLSFSTASAGGGSGEYYWWPTTSPGTVDTTKQPEFTVAAGNIGGTSSNALQKALIGQGHHGITSVSSNDVFAYLIDSTKITVTAASDGATAIGSASSGWTNANWGILFEVNVPMTDWE